MAVQIPWRSCSKVDSDLALTAGSNIQETNPEPTRQDMILGGGRQYRQDNDRVLETATALKQVLDCRAPSTTMLPDLLLRHKEQRRCLQSSRSKPSDPKAGTVLTARDHPGI